MHSRPRPYTRCPVCHLVGPPESIECRPGVAGSIDWHGPVRWRCGGCGVQRRITADDVLADDTTHVCPHCGRSTACPSGAMRAECGGCGGQSNGPAAGAGAATCPTRGTVHAGESDAPA